MGKKSSPAEGEEAVPENLRCSRTDGRQWRCQRRVIENLKLCEIHYLQARRRQQKKALKLKRTRQNDAVEDQIRAKRDRKSREALVNRRNQLELIRMVLQREVEKKKKKESQLNLNLNFHSHSHSHSNHELRKELPNGVMAIASDVPSSRYFRSKNAERGSVSELQCGRNMKKGRRNKCHWCQRSDSWSLIRCSSCQREFFCMDCIKQRLKLGTYCLYLLPFINFFFHSELRASLLSLPTRWFFNYCQHCRVWYILVNAVKCGLIG